MTTQTTVTKSDRSTGWAAIASGIAGLSGVGFLIAYLVIRNNNMDEAMRMANRHDGIVMLQFLLLLPVIIALQKVWLQRPPGMSKAMFRTGMAAACFTVLFLFLGLLKIMADVLYMFPQGIFGVWLIITCWRMRGLLPRGLCWFGIVLGFGLALVGLFPPYYAIFVDPIILSMPAAPDEAVAKIPISHANMIIHQVLWIGSPLGVLTLPFWTLLLGRRLLREKRPQTVDLAAQQYR